MLAMAFTLHTAIAAATPGVSQVVKATVLLAIVLGLGAGLFWLMTRLRGGEAEGARDAHESLAKFRELHARGGLSDEEYRTIKTQLAAKLDEELGNSLSTSDPRDAEALSSKKPLGDDR